MANRKIHNSEAGYIAERNNPHCPGKVAIYQAVDQGIDVGDYKYAVVCDAHDTIGPASNVPDARVLMKHHENFCERCADMAERFKRNERVINLGRTRGS